jgi:hypothetical protein
MPDPPTRDGHVARLAAAVLLGIAFILVVGLDSLGVAHSSSQFAQYGVPQDIEIIRAKATADGRVILRVEIFGWRMYPQLLGTPLNKTDGGHWTIFVDGRCNSVSTNPTTGTTNRLKTGKHKLYAQLANNDGSYLVPPVSSRYVTIRTKLPIRSKPGHASRYCRGPGAT